MHFLHYLHRQVESGCPNEVMEKNALVLDFYQYVKEMDCEFGVSMQVHYPRQLDCTAIVKQFNLVLRRKQNDSNA